MWDVPVNAKNIVETPEEKAQRELEIANREKREKEYRIYAKMLIRKLKLKKNDFVTLKNDYIISKGEEPDDYKCFMFQDITISDMSHFDANYFNIPEKDFNHAPKGAFVLIRIETKNPDYSYNSHEFAIENLNAYNGKRLDFNDLFAAVNTFIAEANKLATKKLLSQL